MSDSLGWCVRLVPLLFAGSLGCGSPRPPVAAPTSAPSPVAAVTPIRAAGDGLYFMDYETSKSKSTIVEFADFLALLEVPISDAGGDATKLEDHVEDGRRVLRSLEQRFPHKPLRYVLSSHWHPHSLSALAPFLDAHVTLVTTRLNFARLAEMLSPERVAQASASVQFVDGDTFTIGDRENTIVAERFVQKDYPHTPTADYLYFQLPRYHALHVACMYSKWTGPPVRGRELITDRERDVMGLIGAKGLAPVSLIRLDREKDGAELLPFADLERLMRDGISSAELSAPFAARSVEDLRANRAKLVDDALRDGLPASIFNGLTYEALGRKDLARALEYATLQALIGPSDANGWDTLGEVEYVMGQPAAARADDRAAKKLGLTTAGEPVWEKDLDDLRRQWAAAAPPGHP